MRLEDPYPTHLELSFTQVYLLSILVGLSDGNLQLKFYFLKKCLSFHPWNRS